MRPLILAISLLCALAGSTQAQEASNACGTRYGVCYGRYAPVGSSCQCGPDPGRILPPPRWSDACGTNRGVCRTSAGPVGSPCGCFGDPGRRLP
jgi:hypothetical protein